MYYQTFSNTYHITKYGTRMGQRSYVEPIVTIHIAYLLRVTANRIQVKRKKSRPYKFRLNRREYEWHPASKISIGQSSWLLPHIHLPLLKRMGIEPYKKMPHEHYHDKRRTQGLVLPRILPFTCSCLLRSSVDVAFLDVNTHAHCLFLHLLTSRCLLSAYGR